MNTFCGFLFSKLGAIGSRSEGPLYFLQQFDYSEIPVEKKVEPWMQDPALQKVLGTKVNITGEMSAGGIQYDSITPYSPPKVADEKGPHLNIDLELEADELWLEKMPPSPPLKPFKIVLKVEWPYRSIWKGICPTTQIYDFFVEFGGQSIWRWSKNKFFSPVLTPVLIPGGKAQAFLETWIIDPNIIQSEGSYTIRGLFIASGQEAEKQVQIKFAQ